MNVKEVFWRRA